MTAQVRSRTPSRSSGTRALAALAWLSFAAPAALAHADETVPADASGAQDAAEPEGAPRDSGWGPIVAGCLGVLAGGWIARKQIQGWKAKS